MIALLLNRYTWYAVVLTAAAAGLYAYRGLLIQDGYDKAMTEVREAAAITDAANRAKELAAAQTLAEIQQKASDEKQRLSAQLSNALDSLRKRPARPAGDVPASPANPVVCTGASLYAEDSAFLVREADRADRLQLDLARCQAAYDEAVKLTN